MPPTYTKLNPNNGFIFRIVHKANIPWILDNGLYSRNAPQRDPNFISIGNPELIDKRHTRVVPVDPHGTLSDYIPFYFTPFSPMLLNIKTGFNGIRKRANEEIVIMASSISKLTAQGTRYLFTDRHAYLQAAQFYSDPKDLTCIDWPLLQNRNFSRDSEDPEKVERYQAEALVYQHLPTDSLIGMMCYNNQVKAELDGYVQQKNLKMTIAAQPNWYFT